MSAFLVRSANVAGENNLYLDMIASKINFDGVTKEYVYYRVALERYDEDAPGGPVTVREGEEFYPLVSYAQAREAFEFRKASTAPHLPTAEGWTLEEIVNEQNGNSRPGFHHQDEPQKTEMPHYTRPPDYHPPAKQFPMQGNTRGGITD